VVGVDASPTLLRYAREADAGGSYLIGDARALPFADGSFDIAVAYNSLMDVDGMPQAVRESARLLVPGGYLCICVTHPLNDAGRFEGKEPDAPFVIRDSYLAKRKFDEAFERDGLAITFHGWCYPLEDYTIALEEAGFTIERLREPRASDEALAAGGPSELRWRRVPLFLHILARKR
jgi:SAM-dependent methyltransferase